jgi:hypothetical protein
VTTTAASRVDFGHADDIPGTNAHAARPLVRIEGGQELNDLAIHIECDEATSIGIEGGDGASFILDRALERRR